MRTFLLVTLVALSLATALPTGLAAKDELDEAICGVGGPCEMEHHPLPIVNTCEIPYARCTPVCDWGVRFENRCFGG